MTINEIINIFPDYQQAWIEAIKLLESEGISYAASLTGYSMSFKQARDDGYKTTVAECEHMAGERTGYNHKQIEVRIEAVKELIKFISYMIQVSLVPPLVSTEPQTNPATTLEPSYQTWSEQSTTLDNTALRETLENSR